MKTIYNIAFTFLSLSIAPWIYAIKKGYDMLWILRLFASEDYVSSLISTCLWIDSIWFRLASYTLYFSLLLLITWCLAKQFPKMDDVQIGKNATIEPMGSEMMLTYFGLFFYALSVDLPRTFILTFIVLLICVYRTQQYMFNPLLTLLGYKYYRVMSGGKGYLWITKTSIGFDDQVSCFNFKAINDNTITDEGNNARVDKR